MIKTEPEFRSPLAKEQVLQQEKAALDRSRLLTFMQVPMESTTAEALNRGSRAPCELSIRHQLKSVLRFRREDPMLEEVKLRGADSITVFGSDLVNPPTSRPV
jgi:hypothetical protein